MRLLCVDLKVTEKDLPGALNGNMGVVKAMLAEASSYLLCSLLY